MSAELVVLGAGSILPRVGHGCAGYALREDGAPEVTLLDCGPGTVRALAAAEIALEDVRRVVLSHFHLDHCLDLFALAFARRNPRARALPLEVLGPPGLERWVGAVADALGPWAHDPDARLLEVLPDASGGGALERGGTRFSFVRTEHTPEALAWRVDLAGGAALCYSGDSGPNPAVGRLARGVDLFVLECSFPDALAVPNHLTPASAAELVRVARPRLALLSHFYPDLAPEEARAAVAERVAAPVVAARDGHLQRFG